MKNLFVVALAAFLSLCAPGAYAQSITAANLPTGTALLGTEFLLAEQLYLGSYRTVKVPVASVPGYVQNNSTITALTGLASPLDNALGGIAGTPFYGLGGGDGGRSNRGGIRGHRRHSAQAHFVNASRA